MSDEQRADWLATSLDLEPHRSSSFDASGWGGAGGELPDPELEQLADLGRLLVRLGPEMALLAQAETTFDPDFAGRLKETLLAAHPSAAQQSPNEAQAGRLSAPTSRGVRGKRLRAALGRVRLLLPVLALALVLL